MTFSIDKFVIDDKEVKQEYYYHSSNILKLVYPINDGFADEFIFDIRITYSPIDYPKIELSIFQLIFDKPHVEDYSCSLIGGDDWCDWGKDDEYLPDEETRKIYETLWAEFEGFLNSLSEETLVPFIAKHHPEMYQEWQEAKNDYENEEDDEDDYEYEEDDSAIYA